MIANVKKKISYENSPFSFAFRLLFLTTIFCFFSSVCWTQSGIKVTVLSSESGEPLIGATIFNESFSAFTDIDGKAELIGLEYRDEVTFSYIGFSDLKLPVYAIRRKNGLIKLVPDATVDTVVVVGRRDDPVEEIPYQLERIKKSDIEFSAAQTAADALSANAGVFVQKTQAGGGSPVVRGFEANRVLLVVDGVRMNNAIYRSGHLQNAVTVDNAMLEQMEVIYGPGSLIYGSDALGGVVHFRTKDPKLNLRNSEKDHNLIGNFYTRFASANLEKRAHVDVNYGKKNWGFLSSFTITDYDAMRAGNNRPDEYPDFGKRFFYPGLDEGLDVIQENQNTNVQVGMGGERRLYYRWWNTEYSQIDFLQKIKLQPIDELSFVFNYQVSTTTDVPRYDNLLDTISQASELKFAEWYYGPQFRTLVSAKMKILAKNNFFDKGTVIAAYQRVHEDRLSRKFVNRIRSVNKEKVFVYTFTADFDKEIGEDSRSLLTYGFDLGHNDVDSRARSFDVKTGKVILNVDTRYPSGGSGMRNYGAYTNYRWRSQDSTLILNGGLRYSAVSLNAQYLTSDRIVWPEEFYGGINTENSDLTWAGSLTWNTKSKWQMRFMAAKAFRAPNIDDWAKIRTKGNKVTVPNINLAPERALNFEATLAKEFGDFNYINKEGTSIKISGTGFYSRLRDAIIRVDSSTIGTPSLLVDDVNYNVQTNINAENANIYGFSGNAIVNMDDKWLFESSINLTKGTSTFSNSVVQDTIIPFAHIPPAYGKTGLTYQNDKLRLELNARYNARKKLENYAISDIEEDGTIDRGGTSDNIEQTPTSIDENGKVQNDGAYGWTTFNFYSSYKINSKLRINLAVENIFDKHYRPFASTISAPGFNVVVALHGTF